MTKRIVFEDPTPAGRGRNGGNVQTFIQKLSETPDKWAVYTREAKYISYYYTIASQRNDVKVAVRRNPNADTHTVYFQYLSSEGQKTRIAQKANRRAKAVKKTTKKTAPKKSAKSSV